MEKRTPRQDLLVENMAKPEGYIGEQVAPAYIVYVHAGSIYKIVPGSNANVANGRAPGAAVVMTNNLPVEVLYSCVERSDRQGVDDSRVATFGTPDMYLLNLAGRAFVGVADQEEAAIATAFFAGANETLSELTLYGKIQQANMLLKGVRGKRVLVGSGSKLLSLRTDSSITDALKNTGSVPATVDPRFVSNAVLAAALNVSEVLEGLDILWPVDGLAVYVKPDKAYAPNQLEQSIRTIVYAPSTAAGSSLYQCWQGYDAGTKSEFVDVEAFTSPKVLNSTMIKIISGGTGGSGSSGSGA